MRGAGSSSRSREVEDGGAGVVSCGGPCSLAMWMMRLLVGAVLAALGIGAARAECVAAPELAEYQQLTPADFAAGPTRLDRLGRVIAPIRVNGQGPFRFIVDTGANRSVVSQGLAAQLGLQPNGVDEVHNVYGVNVAPLVNVASLQHEQLQLGGEAMPMLQGAMLAGEHGLLGVDGMRGRRLLMDFERNCIEITPSRGARRLSRWTTVRGQLRFGHLVLITGRVGRMPVHMFIDTGSNFTMANLALRDGLRLRAESRRRVTDPIVAYSAGEPLVLDTAVVLPRVDLGQVHAESIVAYVGDFHIFQLWNLTEEPALLIGMDVLSRTRGIAIDYERATVHFLLHQPVRTGSRVAGDSSTTQTFTTRR